MSGESQLLFKYLAIDFNEIVVEPLLLLMLVHVYPFSWSMSAQRRLDGMWELKIENTALQQGKLREKYAN